MGTIRLSKIIQKYNVSLSRLEEFLKSKGVVSNDAALTASSIISDSHLEIIDKKFRHSAILKVESFNAAKNIEHIYEAKRQRKEKRLEEERRRLEEKKQKEFLKKEQKQQEQEEFNLKYSEAISKVNEKKLVLAYTDVNSKLYPTQKIAYENALEERRKLEKDHYKLKSYVKDNAIKDPEILSVLKAKKSGKKNNSKEATKIPSERKREVSIQKVTKITTLRDRKNELKLSWKEIKLKDGWIEFYYDKNLYSFQCHQSKNAYNFIINTFDKVLPPLELELCGACVTVLNRITFEEIIELLKLRHSLFHIIEKGIEKGGHLISIKQFSKFSKRIIKLFFSLDRTEYLEYLQEKQDVEYKYIPVFESSWETPDGFLFTIKCKHGYLLVWESTSQTINKATYVFEVRPEELKTLQQLLFDYIISGVQNKRKNLRQKAVKEFMGINYRFINHDDFAIWKSRFDELLVQYDEADNTQLKREDDVSYIVDELAVTYKPVHNITQNAIKKYLERIGDYKNILLESENVDIKALTYDDKWHYFEIKTSAPILCIREALGQILEYAHFSSENKAEKLFVVGLHKMSEEEKTYMRLLRKIYHLPLWYRWFDQTNQILHVADNS